MNEAPDNVWATAQHLERLLMNARGAIRHQDPKANDIDFRAALLTATAHVIATLAPPGDDCARQAANFGRILTAHLQNRQFRERQMNLTEQLLASYEGPESA